MDDFVITEISIRQDSIASEIGVNSWAWFVIGDSEEASQVIGYSSYSSPSNRDFDTAKGAVSNLMDFLDKLESKANG